MIISDGDLLTLALGVAGAIGVVTGVLVAVLISLRDGAERDERDGVRVTTDSATIL